MRGQYAGTLTVHTIPAEILADILVRAASPADAFDRWCKPHFYLESLRRRLLPASDIALNIPGLDTPVSD